jgi:hypothetical protein
MLVLCLASTTACHRFETVNDLKAVVGAKSRITLTAEARGTNSRRLGGVPTAVIGVITDVTRDSISIKADEVIFADLGTVPFAQGEVRFAATDVANVSRETLNRKKSTIVAVLALLGVTAIGIAFSPGNGIFGFGRNDPPTPR